MDLVTGATGFLGAHVVRRLASEGRGVVALDLAVDRDFMDAVCPAPLLESVTLVAGDVTDLHALLGLIEQHGIERIIHLAGVLHIATNADPLRGLEGTGRGTLNVFEAARIAGLRKVAWSSSAGVYGERKGDIDDRTSPAPGSIYGSLKLALEYASVEYRETHGVDITAVRHNLIYGFGRHLKAGPLAPLQHLLQLIEYPALGRPGRLSFADTPMEWVYIQDAVSATLLAAETPATPLPAYNVHGEAATCRRVGEIVKRLVPDAELELEGGVMANARVGRYDQSAIERDLGYRPAFSLEGGLREMIDALRCTAGQSQV